MSASRLIQDGQQYIEVFANGKRQVLTPPTLPYYFSKSDPSKWPQPPPGIVSMQEETVRPLSAIHEAQKWYRVETRTVQDVSAIHRFEEPSPIGRFAESHLAFVDRVLVDHPDFFRAFPNTDPVRTLSFDVENLFGKGRQPAIVSIAWACDTQGEPEAPIHCEQAQPSDEPELLAKFTKAFAGHDPCVVEGYNVEGHDLPLLISRLKWHRQVTKTLTRSEADAWIEEDFEGDKRVRLPGRVVFDVLDFVLKDQQLFGIKNRKLKTVGAWFKLPVLEVKYDRIENLIGTEELARYNRNDVALCRAIGRPHFQNVLALSEYLGSPLNMTMRATPNFFLSLMQGRVNGQAIPRVVSDGQNRDRFAFLYNDPACPMKSDGKTRSPVTGAVVETYKFGLFKPIAKCDVGSQYPSIILALGLGSDNTRFVGWEPYGKFHARRDGDTLTYSLPDHKWKKNFVVEVEGRSELSTTLSKMMEHRFALKAARKKLPLGSPEELELKSQENALKVVYNSLYGGMGAPHARYGSTIVAMTITATARLMIRVIEECLGANKIATDTDGVYASHFTDKEAVNHRLAEWAKETLLVDGSAFKVDRDEYDGGYFSERKTYLLWKDGKIEKHGQAFKSSAQCGIFDKTLDELAGRVFEEDRAGAVAVVRRALDLAFPVEDFVFRVRPKRLEEYEKGNPIGAQVVRSYVKVHGEEPEPGDFVEYVKSTRGYEVVTAESVRRIDRAYYSAIVEDLGRRFDVERDGLKQTGLSAFL